jgi:hypothetical protein
MRSRDSQKLRCRRSWRRLRSVGTGRVRMRECRRGCGPPSGADAAPPPPAWRGRRIFAGRVSVGCSPLSAPMRRLLSRVAREEDSFRLCLCGLQPPSGADAAPPLPRGAGGGFVPTVSLWAAAPLRRRCGASSPAWRGRRDFAGRVSVGCSPPSESMRRLLPRVAREEDLCRPNHVGPRPPGAGAEPLPTRGPVPYLGHIVTPDGIRPGRKARVRAFSSATLISSPGSRSARWKTRQLCARSPSATAATKASSVGSERR